MAIIEFGTDELDVALEGDVEVEAPVAEVSVDPSLTQPPAVPAVPAAVIERRRVTADLNGRLSGWWAVALVVAWVAIYTVGVNIEPAPTDPDAAPNGAEMVFGLSLFGVWVVTAIGLAKRRRYGAAASFVGGLLLVALTFGCVATGHHSGIGAWWWFELAGSTTLVGLSGRALRSA